eukprot:3510460-Amphidinium_carterae.1
MSYYDKPASNCEGTATRVLKRHVQNAATGCKSFNFGSLFWKRSLHERALTPLEQFLEGFFLRRKGLRPSQ